MLTGMSLSSLSPVCSFHVHLMLTAECSLVVAYACNSDLLMGLHEDTVCDVRGTSRPC